METRHGTLRRKIYIYHNQMNDQDTMIELRPLSELRTGPDNDKMRLITKEKFNRLLKLITRFGQLGALLVDGRDRSTLLGGNHAFEAMKQLGMSHAKVEYRTPKDDAEALELSILHNQRFAEWIEDGLAEIVYKYKQNIDLSQYTIDLGHATDLKKVLARYGNTDEDEFDVGAAIPEVAESQMGKVYQLGRHRIMCGDSTKKEDVDTLMGESKASAIVTDPPYGVSYEGNPNGETYDKIANDDLRGDDLFQFLLAAFGNINKHIIEKCPMYCFYASSTHIQFQTAIETAGFKVRQQLIWAKHMVLGNSDYHWSHEPIMYCGYGEDKPIFYGDRTNTTLIKEIKWEDMKKMSKEELLAILSALKERSTYLNASQDSQHGIKYDHPTQKPISVMTPLIKNSTMPEDIVVDLFTGSGTTLIATHQLDRVFYGMEFDPKFVDVIRKRYAKFVGQESKWQELTPEINNSKTK